MKKIKINLKKVLFCFLQSRFFGLPFLNRVRKLFYKIVYKLGKIGSIGNYVNISYPHNQLGVIKIDDGSIIGDNVYIDCTGEVYIGKNVILSRNSCVYSHSHDYLVMHKEHINDVIAKKTIIEEGVWLGDGVIVLAGVSIGKNSVVGAGSIVTKDLESNCVFAGNPARLIKRIDEQNE